MVRAPIIPVQKVHPALMQMVWRKFAPVLVQALDGRHIGFLPGKHVCFRGHLVAFL